MLPEALSTDRTSLNPGEDRAAVVIDMTLAADGAIAESDVYRAAVHNHARLTYQAVAGWLDGTGPAPDGMAGVPGLEAQVRQQDRIASRLRTRRREEGALDFDRIEVKPVMDGARVSELRTEESNRARDMIESFMIAANGVTARSLGARVRLDATGGAFSGSLAAHRRPRRPIWRGPSGIPGCRRARAVPGGPADGRSRHLL